MKRLRSKTHPPTRKVPPTYQPYPGPIHVHAPGEPTCEDCQQRMALAQQNERVTPPQREDPVPRPDPDNQRPAPPTVQGAPAQQNERVAHPQRENQVPRPGPSSKRTAPPLAQGAPPQQVTRSGRVSMRPPTLVYQPGFVPQESRHPTGAFRLPRAVAPKQPKTAGPTDV